MKSVVVTGASTGIGWATAKLLLDRGFRVFGSVRKQADADRLKGEFGANFTPLLFDVTDEAAVLAAARDVRAALNGEKLAGLVNNAGIAVAGPVLGLSADEFRRQMDVNVIGPIIATQAFGPLLGADTSLEGGARADRDDLVGRRQERQSADLGLFGVKACHRRIVGGPAPRTDAVRHRRHHRGARCGEDADLEQGRGTSIFLPTRTRRILPAMEKMRTFMLHLGANGLPPERIAETVYAALTLPRPKVRYSIVPDPVRVGMMKALPKRALDKIIAKRLGLMPPA